MAREKTIGETLSFEGIGIHTGERARVVLHPEEEGKGIMFYKEGTFIPANYRFVVNTNHSTDLGREGVVIKTVEHLLAVLHLLEITNLTIEVNGPEIPILDGSGQEFYKALKDSTVYQNTEVEYFEIKDTVEISSGKAYAKAEPSEFLEITYEDEFNNFLGKQSFTFFEGNEEEIVLARTFCFDWEIEYIKKAGLGKGGSLENTLVLGKEKVYNPDGLRFKDEPVRHKVFDIVGDLYLLGKPVKGKIYSFRGGHSLNYKLVKKLAEIEKPQRPKRKDVAQYTA
ncbi:MAG TPA: UDP-3-O-[3-hydroxymyristoyl] N-acetylglucosamine deacetylase [Aquificaceae bacterium]|nr:UDP-3-O-[3-hydroxymyristoyl] N-acetylglucosamine deacetylase [Aquificaceae bacterium]HIQ49145.1 UDP-3-O-[3-hydroxymyristoyl] N-acetylglucosamine deacetylase [Aquifex aeolicus]